MTNQPARDLDSLMACAAEQGGIVSRAQARGCGLSDCWLRHQVAARRWQRVHPGVYATFTGDLPWESRCWAALLRCGEGAALAGSTALEIWTPGPTSGSAVGRGDVVVAVDERRRVSKAAGVDIWRVDRLEQHVHPVRRPRRLRFESAVLLTASRTRASDDAIAVIADACQSRCTTPARLRTVLEEMPHNLRFRPFLRKLLDDVATGAYSYLEVHYLRDVERPHGLPTGRRQRRVKPGRHPSFRDVEYLGFDVIAELDGRLGHEDLTERSGDMQRDNDATRNGSRTARIGYHQVMSRCCDTAQVVVDLLRLGGWPGRPRPCGPACPVGRAGSTEDPAA